MAVRADRCRNDEPPRGAFGCARFCVQAADQQPGGLTSELLRVIGDQDQWDAEHVCEFEIVETRKFDVRAGRPDRAERTKRVATVRTEERVGWFGECQQLTTRLLGVLDRPLASSNVLLVDCLLYTSPSPRD